MSDVQPQPSEATVVPDAEPDEPRGLGRDVLVVLIAFAVAALVAGVLWPQLVDPVLVERAEQGVLTSEVALSHRFDNVGWYALLGGAFGLLLGVVLLARRRGHEVITLLAVLAGACLAAWLSARVGTWLGPDDPQQVLRDAEVGDTAPDRVVLTADVAYLVWPISAMVGSVLVLWGTRSLEDRDDRPRSD